MTYSMHWIVDKDDSFLGDSMQVVKVSFNGLLNRLLSKPSCIELMKDGFASFDEAKIWCDLNNVHVNRHVTKDDALFNFVHSALEKTIWDDFKKCWHQLMLNSTYASVKAWAESQVAGFADSLDVPQQHASAKYATIEFVHTLKNEI